MKLGFTGTRNGMTPQQWHAFCGLLEERQPTELHHGSCVGADSDAHCLFCRFAHNSDAVCEEALVVAHLPDKDDCRAYLSVEAENYGISMVQKKPLPYLTRNRNIVDSCDVLVACPAEMEEQQRGGTWSTVRYARKVGRDLVLILPDGSTA